MYKFYLKLDNETARSLMDLARDEARDPKAQARIIVKQYLIESGRLILQKPTQSQTDQNQNSSQMEREL